MANPKITAAKAAAPDYSEYEMRARALELAIDAKKFKDETAETTVTIAETFYKFLNTKTPEA